MSGAWIRHPCVFGDRVAFCADDDLYVASITGGLARRVLASTGSALRPRATRDHRALVFDDLDDNVRDVFAVGVDGGPVRRLTWGGASVLGVFDDRTDRGAVVAVTDVGRPFARDTLAYELPEAGGAPIAWPLGPLAGLAISPGSVLVCRHQADLSMWKGYRGGRMGVFWLGRGEPGAGPLPGAIAWRRVEVPFAVAHPTAARGRFWFVGDPDRVPQLCSIDPDGSDLRVHTRFPDLAVRHPHGDGDEIVFVHGGELYRMEGDDAVRVPLAVHPQRAHRDRRAFSAAKYLDEVELHPDGHSLHVATRGQIVTMGHWEGPVVVRAAHDGVRFRCPRAVDADRLLLVSDRSGEERFEIHGRAGLLHDLRDLVHGRPVEVTVAPGGRRAAFVDHEHVLRLLDLEDHTLREVDRAPLEGFELDWSRDGDWLAWARHADRHAMNLWLLEVASGTVSRLTDGPWRDWSPSFDPDGHHLYFLSHRDYDPVRQSALFGYAFTRGTRAYCATLRRDVPHPFQPQPRPLERKKDRKEEATALAVDVEGFADRVVPFPVADGRYRQVHGVGHGHVLLVREPVLGTLGHDLAEGGNPTSDDTLLVYELEKQELTELAQRVGPIRLDRKRDTLAIRSGQRVRVVASRPDKAARDELKKTEGAAGRKTGWIDLGRIRLEVEPAAEWAQMVGETWRRMRDHYWRPLEPTELARFVDARDRYAGLVARISTRSELSEVLTALQGELGTSHAYEIGGDWKTRSGRRVGRLGADLDWDDAHAGWRIERILRGDPGTPRTSPLLAPGACVREGEVVRAVDGRRVRADRPLAAELLGRAGVPVELELVGPDGSVRHVPVVPLGTECDLRYRDWVLDRRAHVAARAGGRVAYVHVPDMGPSGYAEFHRDYHATLTAEALLVDVRYNRGGHVSQLLLPFLTQRRIGEKHSRHGPPRPYPLSAPGGPMALVTNELAGSDGDIFTHAWKRLGLGPVFGTRTWGGVVGIVPRVRLADRTLVTQPEHATWFDDVGYGLENHGAVPDHVIEVLPGERADPQLDAALDWLTSQVRDTPVSA